VSGIYVHIPFCRQKCHYCNFFSVASDKYKKRFLDTLTEETFIQRNFFNELPVQSLYFGGGTPSLLSFVELESVFNTIKSTFLIEKDAEITLEANPDDLTIELLKKYRDLGFNRLSIGVQSFFDDDLGYLNRLHSAGRAYDSVKEAQKAGFENISIDLIYGIPTLTDEKWQKNLDIAFSLQVPHISAYALTVEPKTTLDVLIAKKKLPAPEEEQVVKHFRILSDAMKYHEYLHYEISNFCKPDFFSRHNSMYWSGAYYLGLGPAAHSFNGITRRWNVSSILHYATLINQHERYYEEEVLTDVQKYNEFVMVSLRTMWGCDGSKIRALFGESVKDRFVYLVTNYIQKGMIIEKEGIYFLTEEGKLFADGIASDLFLEPEDGSKREPPPSSI